MSQEYAIPGDLTGRTDAVPAALPVRPGSILLPEGPEVPANETLARYARRPEFFRRAAAVKLLVDGREAYPEMLAAIDSASRTVDLETYIFADDGTGRRFREALCRAAQRGVRVRLLYDYIGSLYLSDSFVRPMLEAGAEVAVFHPPVLSRPLWALNRRNHRKTLLVDGRVTFTGGLNIADHYAPSEDGGGGWRDTHVRIDGRDVADQAQGLFEYAWRRAVPHAESSSRRRRLRAAIRRLRLRGGSRGLLGGPRREDARRAVQVGPSGQGGAAVRLLGNREFGTRNRIHRSYLYAIGKARRYILIENAYFIPGRAVRRALSAAVRRGVVVAVAVARDSDVKIAASASRYLYGRLLRSGVRLFEWPLGMLHAKTAVIDDAWAIVGSYNFDHRSLFCQLESIAVIAEAAFARRLRDQTLADLDRCREVTREAYNARPPLRRLVEWLAYQLRHWL